jgi:hypothetical protein
MFLQPNQTQTSPIKEGIPDPSLINISFCNKPTHFSPPFNTTKTFKKKKKPHSLKTRTKPLQQHTSSQKQTNKQTIPETKYNNDLYLSQNQNHSTQLQTLKTCMTLSKEEAAKRKERWRLVSAKREVRMNRLFP